MNRRNFIKGLLATATIAAINPTLPLHHGVRPAVNFEAMVAITLKNYAKVITDSFFVQSEYYKRLAAIAGYE